MPIALNDPDLWFVANSLLEEARCDGEDVPEIGTVEYAVELAEVAYMVLRWLRLEAEATPGSVRLVPLTYDPIGGSLAIGRLGAWRGRGRRPTPHPGSRRPADSVWLVDPPTVPDIPVASAKH